MDDKKKINTELSKINRENPFNIPEGYFDNFSSRLSDKIHASEAPGFYEKYVLAVKPYLAIAAFFISVVILGIVFYNVFFPGNNIKELKPEEIVELINEDAYYLSEESILEIIYINDAGDGDEKADNSGENLTNEVIDYLINEEINIIDIIDAL